jgi:hypothetical protein
MPLPEPQEPRREVRRQSLRMRRRVAKLAVKEAKLAVQEEQDGQVERPVPHGAAISARCSAECPRRLLRICKRVMR